MVDFTLMFSLIFFCEVCVLQFLMVNKENFGLLWYDTKRKIKNFGKFFIKMKKV